MPGMYADGEYDLAGFSVGVVDKAKLIDGKRVAALDAVIGIASSGLHSNGYSLVRRAVLERAKLPLDRDPGSLGEPLADALMRPTRIYARAVKELLASGADVRAISHITGGGLPGNVPRVLPDDLGVEIDVARWPRPPIFDVVQRCGEVAESEMRRAFNIGLGLVVVVPEPDAARAMEAAERAGEKAYRIGRVVATPGAEFEARVRFVG